METRYHYLSIESEGLSVLAGINGAPLFMCDEGQRFEDIPINAWLASELGDNVLTVNLFWPAGEEFSPGKAKIKATVYIADPESASPRPLETLATFVWPKKDSNGVLVPEAYPHRESIPFVLSEKIPTRLWEEAKVMESLSEEDQQAILDQVYAYAAAIETGNVDVVFEHIRYKIEDIARANGHDPTEQAVVAKQQMGWMYASSVNEVMQPNELDPAEFRLCGFNRVVWVRRASGEPALEMRTERRSFSFPLYFAQIKGKWIIVR